MNTKKLVLIAVGIFAVILFVILGVTTPYSVTTEVLTVDELREVDDVFDERYLLYIDLLHTLDRAEQDLSLSGPPAVGKIYITRTRYLLASGQTLLTIPIAAQSAPAEGENWLFEFHVLSMAWTDSGLEQAETTAMIEPLSLRIDADTSIRYAEDDPNGSAPLSGAVSQKEMREVSKSNYQVRCFVSRGPANVNPTTAVWSGELVMRQGLRSQRFEFSLNCVTDYDE